MDYFEKKKKEELEKLLNSKFKKIWDLIPDEFKNNYLFVEFIGNIAEMYSEINENEVQSEKRIRKFDVIEEKKIKAILEDSGMHKTVICNTKENKYTYSQIECTIDNDKKLHFRRCNLTKDLFVFHQEQTLEELYNRGVSSIITRELNIEFNEDKSKLLITESNNYINRQEKKVSIFDFNGKEITQVSEGEKLENQEVIRYKNEITSIKNASLEYLKTFHNSDELKKEDYYLVKAQKEENTKYAIIWRDSHWVNDELRNKTFQAFSFHPDSFFDSLQPNSYIVTCGQEIDKETYDFLNGQDISAKLKI